MNATVFKLKVPALVYISDSFFFFENLQLFCQMFPKMKDFYNLGVLWCIKHLVLNLLMPRNYLLQQCIS